MKRIYSYRDIDLSVEAIAAVTKYRNFGTTWMVKCIIARQVQEYIEQVLERFDSDSSQRGRCYVVGHSYYRRKDGGPMLPADVEAIKLLDCGQINRVTGVAGDYFLKHSWECDSGD